jgi:hypothetical protein
MKKYYLEILLFFRPTYAIQFYSEMKMKRCQAEWENT